MPPAFYICSKNGHPNECFTCRLDMPHRFEILVAPGEAAPHCRLHGPLRRSDIDEYYRSERATVRAYESGRSGRIFDA